MLIGIPYRQTEGVIESTWKKLTLITGSYGHLCKKINRMSVDIKEDDEEEEIIIADYTGIKVTNKRSMDV